MQDSTKKTLNKAQKQAVEHLDGPLLIVAGAGTGKTTVVTEKILHILESGAAKPEEVLALTFTEKAAQEMQERVDMRLNIGYVDLQISTFHAFCQRILENYAIDIGLPDKFTLVTQTEAWLLMKEHLYDLPLEYYRPLGNPTRSIHALIKHFSKCKDELVTPEAYITYAENVALAKDAVQVEEKNRLTEVANAYHAYNQLLLNNNALDFGDLIFYAHTLLEKREKIKQAIQTRYKYMLVDEFQDVNYAQYELVKLLSKQSQLTVVGDDDQSIYAFRGASVSNILRFKEDYPTASEIVLTENYRSGQEILDASYTLIQENNPDRLESKLSINKKLIAKGKEKKGDVTHVQCETAYDEVQYVIEQISEALSRGVNASEIALLVRANNHAEAFIEAFEKQGITYQYRSSRGLFRRSVILDCFHYLKTVVRYSESASIYRLLRLPHLRLSVSDLHKITSLAKQKSVSYYEALKRAQEFRVSKEGIAVCQRLLDTIHAGMRQAKNEKSTRVLYAFVEKIGYLTHLTDVMERNPSAASDIQALRQFFEYVGRFEEVRPGASVEDFIDYFSSLLESGDEGKIDLPNITEDAVQVMTIHSAKGLEFEQVFLANLVEDRFPTRRRKEAIELPDDLIQERLPEGDYHIQEERRLFYVGLTRAKKQVHLLAAKNYGGVREKKPSRFLAELNREEITAAKSASPILSTADSRSEEENAFVYQLPKKFSFSQIRAFQICKYQYKLAYLLKLPMKGNPAFSFGSSMHNTLQAFYEKIQELNGLKQDSLFGMPVETAVESNIKVPSLEELYEIYERKWISDWYTSTQQREKRFAAGKKILKEFYEAHSGSWTIPVAIESGFQISIGKYLIHGRVDRIDAKDGSLEIIDYKTGKPKEKLNSFDKQQLLLYQIAASELPEYRHLGNVEKLTYAYLEGGSSLSFVGTAADIEKMKEKLIGVLDEIHETDFSNITKAHMCGQCEFCTLAGKEPV